MTPEKLEKPTWHAYFDQVSKLLEGKRAEIEVDSLAIGSQVEAEWLPLHGIVYDPKSDVIEIVLEGLDHMIPHPEAVYIEQDALGLSSLAVSDADGNQQIVRLRDPIMLPPPP